MFHEKGYKIVGDVDYENVSKKSSYITPWATFKENYDFGKLALRIRYENSR